MDKMREEFEAWHIEQCKANGMDWRDLSSELDRDGDGYVYTDAQYAWRGWKASRASLCIELPENCKGMALTVDEFHKQLDKAGVTYK